MTFVYGVVQEEGFKIDWIYLYWDVIISRENDCRKRDIRNEEKQVRERERERDSERKRLREGEKQWRSK